jgi:uncharacterized membrane protein
MRRALLIAAAASALALPAAAATATPAPSGPVAHIACKQARIAGESKCISRGEFCRHSSRAMRDYARYGLHCNRRDANGRWHLT